MTTQATTTDRVVDSLKLYFTANSVRNTTLANKDDSIYFEVVTRFWHPKLTKINILDPETRDMRLVAEIERVGRAKKYRNGRYRIRFISQENSGSKQEWGRWISDIDFLEPANEGIGGDFIDPRGNGYRWKTHNRRLQLIPVGEETQTPLVTYESHKRYFLIFRMSRHASWEVKPQVVNFLDRILVSYILIERRRRAEKQVIDRII
ncbi:hypothetical protein GYMLUDRAFT_171901 [Collybiopsis luxurians FD-317 M1]|uniref:DUF6593 domain-containing protein n=1 Tax=Collybiopsis luxurians FD-317 M1 TaxID=944289 RepID=A0A0D0B3W1_9AGAR|nr:hypothetical protein GYMLUDRAFT_171901 [Collybiopsis luxurians FD-317 M1]